MAVVIQWRRGMASDWTGVNPQLAQGEAGVELDTWKWKMGDGKKRWIELPYMTGDGGPIPDEVWVGPQDPGQIQPAAATELWYDTLGPPPVLKVKLPTGEWRPIGGEEVFIGTTNPGPTYELWYDTTTSPGILKARRGTAWEPIGGAGHDEVWTGPSTPNPAVPYELWYDTSTSPGRLYARAPSGEWVSVVSSEVSVKDTDPYAAGPNSSQAELWFDETTSILYARVNDTWVPASSTSDARDEVLVSPSQPRDVTTELWYDTSTTPGVLKAHLPDGSWENTSAAPSGPGIDEVWVGQNPPDPVGTYELWFDISNPPVLKAKMPNGAWVPTTKQEVVVGPADPDLDTATPGVELWYDTTTGVLKARKGLGWENVSTAGGGEEVAIGPDDPAVKDPKIELWFDPTARPAGAPTAPKLDWTFVTYSVEATPGTPPAGDGKFSIDSDQAALATTIMFSARAGQFDYSEGFEEIAVGHVLRAQTAQFGEWWRFTVTTAPVRTDAVFPYYTIGITQTSSSGTQPIFPVNQYTFWTVPDPADLDATNPTGTLIGGALKARVNDAWQDVYANADIVIPDEVHTGPTQPRDKTTELWYDTTTVPGILKAKNEAGDWEEVSSATTPIAAPDEVFVGPTPPRDRQTEIWFDTNEPVPPVEPPLDEVWINGVSPDPAKTYELWYDISTDPGMLKAKMPNGLWVPVTASSVPEPPLDEVWVGAGPPDPAKTYELWYDTTPDPRVLKVRMPNGVWEDVTSATTPEPPLDEVWVASASPDPAKGYELWYDVTTLPGVLKAKRPNGVWEDVVPAGITDEVLISPDDPLIADPASPIELWYDTNDQAIGAGFGVPPGGLASQHLAKASDTDGDTEWVPNLPVNGAAGAPLTKIDATDGNVQWGGDIIMGAGKKVLFPTEVGDKLVLYNAASGSRFGLGIQSGELRLFVEQAGNKIGFNVGGTERAFIDQNGLGPRTNYNVVWQNGFTGTAQFRVNPAVVTLALWHFTNGVELLSYDKVKIFDYPAGVPAPWMNVTAAIAPQWMGSTYGYVPLRIDCMTDGVYVYANNYIDVGDLWECACTVTWAR